MTRWSQQIPQICWSVVTTLISFQPGPTWWPHGKTHLTWKLAFPPVVSSQLVSFLSQREQRWSQGLTYTWRLVSPAWECGLYSGHPACKWFSLLWWMVFAIKYFCVCYTYTKQLSCCINTYIDGTPVFTNRVYTFFHRHFW